MLWLKLGEVEADYILVSHGLSTHAQHLGGRHQFPFGSVKLTLAFHGAGVPGGHACGSVVDYYGLKVYFAGGYRSLWRYEADRRT